MTSTAGPAGVAAQSRPLPAGPAPRERVRAWMSWSTGKDSAYALRLARASSQVDVAGLFTTVDADAGRVAYNEVPVCLAQAQAQALGLPLHILPIPAGCSDHEREALRRDVLSREAVPAGIKMLIFGDAGGRDIRASRAARLAGLGIRAVFRCGGWTPGCSPTRSWPRASAQSSPGQTCGRPAPGGRAGRSMRNSSPPSPRTPTRAGRTGNSTPSPQPAQTSATLSRSLWTGSPAGTGRRTRS